MVSGHFIRKTRTLSHVCKCIHITVPDADSQFQSILQPPNLGFLALKKMIYEIPLILTKHVQQTKSENKKKINKNSLHLYDENIVIIK